MGNFSCGCTREQLESAKGSASTTYEKVSKTTSENYEKARAYTAKKSKEA
jgi:hypothetical protein